MQHSNKLAVLGMEQVKANALLCGTTCALQTCAAFREADAVLPKVYVVECGPVYGSAQEQHVFFKEVAAIRHVQDLKAQYTREFSFLGERREEKPFNIEEHFWFEYYEREVH